MLDDLTLRPFAWERNKSAEPFAGVCFKEKTGIVLLSLVSYAHKTQEVSCFLAYVTRDGLHPWSKL